MSLEDKRLKYDLISKILPKITQQLKDTVGSAVDINIDWESFTSTECMQEIEHQVFDRVLDALKAVAVDDVGRQALMSLSSISVINLLDKDERKCSFSKGVLSLQTDWTDFWSIFSAVDIQKVLEESL